MSDFIAESRRSSRRVAMAVVGLLAFAMVAGCESTPGPRNERTVEDLYNSAMDELLNRQYHVAAAAFEEVERQHPYSIWATKAQLMAGYSYYQDNNYGEAVGALERFIQLHPGNKDIPYAFYLSGLCYYEQISDIGRDQSMTVEAHTIFEELIRRFPDSKYARDARGKLVLTRDHLAGKEMAVGRTYQDLEFYVAAIKRFRTVIEAYQSTSHVPEALHRLTESYLALGVISEAQATAAVLGYNFPDSEWYQDTYAMMAEEELQPRLSEGSWLFGLF